jgi:isopentenyl phosphate kinase
MGTSSKIVLVKLGGSVITDKDRPMSPNLRNIRTVAKQLSRALIADKDLRLILIHGGGSFGHYYAKKFGLGREKTNGAAPEGLAWTAASMIELHSVVLNVLCNAGVYCGTILPIELLSGLEKKLSVSEAGKSRINSLFANGLRPITFGYVNLEGNYSYIVSGDTIALAIAKSFSVEKAVFVMDVDGVYPTPDLAGEIVEILTREDTSVRSSLREYDVTGGIQAKISTGFDLSELGSDVYFLNGTKPNRLFRAITGSRDVLATRIYSTK